MSVCSVNANYLRVFSVSVSLSPCLVSLCGSPFPFIDRVSFLVQCQCFFPACYLFLSLSLSLSLSLDLSLSLRPLTFPFSKIVIDFAGEDIPSAALHVSRKQFNPETLYVISGGLGALGWYVLFSLLLSLSLPPSLP